MPDKTPTASAGPPPRVVLDAQDPLPESSWGWRRGLVFWGHAMQCVAIGYILFLMWKIANIMEGTDSVGGLIQVIGALTKIAFWVVCIMALDRTLYLIAPSAEQATKMIQTVSAWKAGVPTKTHQQVTATTQGVVATATSEAGYVTNTDPAPTTGTSASIDPGSSEGAGDIDPSDDIPSEPPNRR